MHREIGQFAAEHNIDKLLAVGPLSQTAVEGYQAAQGAMSQHFTDQQSLVDMIKSQVNSSMVILVKGSRSSGMDKIVTLLTQEV